MKKIGIGVLVLGLLAAVYFLRDDSPGTPSPDTSTVTPGPNPGIQGNVVFHSNGGQTGIDVEIARSVYEHSKGLMDRTSLPHDQGMLFIFDEMAPRSFWMRNTRISLDIIYVDDRKKIVSIQKNAVPMSDESLPSSGPARYVIEVNGGFTDLYNILPGDSLSFQIP